MNTNDKLRITEVTEVLKIAERPELLLRSRASYQRNLTKNVYMPTKITEEHLIHFSLKFQH